MLLLLWGFFFCHRATSTLTNKKKKKPSLPGTLLFVIAITLCHYVILMVMKILAHDSYICVRHSAATISDAIVHVCFLDGIRIT